MGVGMRHWRGAGAWLAALLLVSAPLAAGDAVGRDMAAFLRDDCGACHGMTLRGGLGPPLTAAALAGRSAEELRAVIRDGRPGTAMPPWSGQLSDAQIEALVTLLRVDADGDGHGAGR
jgi:cytochrome c55X